jgi:hypothetical protein
MLPMMNRLLRVVAIASLVCACAPTQQQPPPAPAAPPVPALATDDANVKLTIIMATNPGHMDPKVTAACQGTVTMSRARAQRKMRVRWQIKNDDDNPCPNLDSSQVSVRFDLPTLAAGTDPTEAVLSEVYGQGNAIRTRVHADEKKVPDSKRKYTVWYKGLRAAPDPDLDIQGECPTCAP